MTGRLAGVALTACWSPDRLVIDQTIQPQGGIFGKDFDPDLIDYVDWGRVRLEFDTEYTGHVWFESNIEEYGSGDYPIERLARPLLADCSEGDTQ